MGRNYRDDVTQQDVENFHLILNEKEDELGFKTPIFTRNNVNYAYVKRNNLHLVSLSRKNVNVTAALAFLHKIIEVFSQYFGEFDEEAVRDNFVTIYELLDEMIDFGFPQITESRILQEYITQEGYGLTSHQVKPPMAVTNAVSWRSEGVFYRKNEVFIDVIESVNLLANATGQVVRCEVEGAIKMNALLTGMPELRLGLNELIFLDNTDRNTSSRNNSTKGVELEDVKFHQCVRLSRFHNDRTISFIPPDGEFDLMNYRLSTQARPLIWVEVLTEKHAHSRIEFMVKAVSNFKRRCTANNVVIKIPVPEDADSPKFRTSIGTVKYAADENAFAWSIKSFPGAKELLLNAHFSLPSIESTEPETKRPIRVAFEVPYYTVSGLQVKYLKIIEKQGYSALPWVRYLTKDGDYQLRMA